MSADGKPFWTKNANPTWNVMGASICRTGIRRENAGVLKLKPLKALIVGQGLEPAGANERLSERAGIIRK